MDSIHTIYNKLEELSSQIKALEKDLENKIQTFWKVLEKVGGYNPTKSEDGLSKEYREAYPLDAKYIAVWIEISYRNGETDSESVVYPISLIDDPIEEYVKLWVDEKKKANDEKLSKAQAALAEKDRIHDLAMLAALKAKYEQPNQ